MIFYIGFGLLAFMAALWDFLFYRVPNQIVLAIICLFFLMVISGYFPSSLMLTFLISAIILIVCYVFYVFGWCGAGDAKFIFAASLWAGSQYGAVFLLSVAFMGGVLALFYVPFAAYIDKTRQFLISFLSRSLNRFPLFNRYAQEPFIYTNAKVLKEIKVPYGIAVAMGSFVVIYLLSVGHWNT